jgi:hypothetical protein
MTGGQEESAEVGEDDLGAREARSPQVLRRRKRKARAWGLGGVLVRVGLVAWLRRSATRSSSRPRGRWCRGHRFRRRPEPTRRGLGSPRTNRGSPLHRPASGLATRRCYGRERAAPRSVSQPRIRRRDLLPIDIHRSTWRNRHRGSNQQCRSGISPAGTSAPAGRLAPAFQLGRPDFWRVDVRRLDARPGRDDGGCGHHHRGPDRARPLATKVPRRPPRRSAVSGRPAPPGGRTRTRRRHPRGSRPRRSRPSRRSGGHIRTAQCPSR